MGDHDFPATCLSSIEHGHDIRDVFLHYFGCLKDAERKVYFDALPLHKQQRIQDEKVRILEQRALFEADDEKKYMVKRLRTSLNHFFRSSTNRQDPLPDPKIPCRENGYNMSANMVFFRNSAPFDDDSCPDKFPNQKIPLKDLLYNQDKKHNPLMRPCEQNEIRYFHLPANNMEWVEEAIARYFNEQRPEYDGLFRRPDKPSKSYMLLRPQFWRGQQHGGRHDAVHARLMRPRCDIISTDPDNLEDSPKNLVLFMPYLHWETDRRRAKFDEVMRNITEAHREKEAKELVTLATLPSQRNGNATSLVARKNTSQGTNGMAEASRLQRPFSDPATDFRMISSTTEVMEAAIRAEVKNNPTSKLSKTKLAKRLAPGILAPSKVLGQIFHRAALLSEAMDYHNEQELLKAYLHNDPPFHPRRTLDQSYYWTLKNTKKRDRDQVVYRGTAPNKEFMHSGVHVNCGCTQCLEDIRKVPRVIMVDQLWLWILDGNTIITSFPKRHGRNKPDPSAVHKSIRMRLKVCRKNEIRSAYDLALIIIDQCSRVFFDRTKTADRQPQVMDLFATAIGNVSNRQTRAYDHFWDTSLEASTVYMSKDIVDDIKDKAKSLLDINPEGKLLREIKDILDELHIMINIKNSQQRVFKQFRKHLLHMIAPSLSLSTEIGTAKQIKVTGGDNSDVLDEEGEGEKPAEKRRHGKAETKEQRHCKSERDAKWTLEFGLDLSNSLDDRIADLNNLKESAERTEKALDGLLGLKQQQAGVIQARKAVQQTEETLRQGRSIMLFTVITIIFLPLSFGASFFGMNTTEFNDGHFNLRRELKFILPIATGVILLSLILAFSAFTRAVLYYVIGITWIKFITSTRIYSAWIQFKIDSHSLTNLRMEKVHKWKQEARDQKQKRKEKRKLEKLKKKQELEEKELASNPRPKLPVRPDNVV